MFQEQVNLIRQDILQEMKSERLAMVQEVKAANSNILHTLSVVSDTDNTCDTETTSSISSGQSEYANNIGTDNVQLEMLKILQKLDQKLDENPRASKRQRYNNHKNNTSPNNIQSKTSQVGETKGWQQGF